MAYRNAKNNLPKQFIPARVALNGVKCALHFSGALCVQILIHTQLPRRFAWPN